MTARTGPRGAAALLAAALATAGISAAVAAPATAAPDPGVVPGAWIVTLAEGASASSVAAEHSQRHGAVVDHVYRHAVRGYAARMSATAAAKVASDRRVLSVEPDRVVSIAAKPGSGTPVTSAQTTPTGVLRADGEQSTTLAGNGSGEVVVDVAIIDTGIDLDHPDLNVHLAGARNCTTGRSADDGNGHGTHVAGTVGARDDGQGVVGMAPGARVWPVRVLDDRGSGTTSSVICGVDWVTQNAGAIEVANMSLGGGGSEPSGTGCSTSNAYHDAVCRSVAAGVTYVVAAGNSAADASTAVPAAFDEVITVSALADFNGEPGGGAAATCRADVDDTFASFSNFGADVDLIAPGVCITSTWLAGGYDTISGTSMASPHVAGAAALYRARNASASPAQVKAALQSAGTLDWNAVDDRDRTQERLLNAAGF